MSTVKKHALPLGLLVGEAQPRKSASPWVTGDVGLDSLRMFAHAEASDHAGACQAASEATSHADRDALVGAARVHAGRLQQLNLLIRMRGGLPIVGPAIRVL